MVELGESGVAVILYTLNLQSRSANTENLRMVLYSKASSHRPPNPKFKDFATQIPFEYNIIASQKISEKAYFLHRNIGLILLPVDIGTSSRCMSIDKMKLAHS